MRWHVVPDRSKSLKLSSTARAATSVGVIVNIMTNDGLFPDPLPHSDSSWIALACSEQGQGHCSVLQYGVGQVRSFVSGCLPSLWLSLDCPLEACLTLRRCCLPLLLCSPVQIAIALYFLYTQINSERLFVFSAQRLSEDGAYSRILWSR